MARAGEAKLKFLKDLKFKFDCWVLYEWMRADGRTIIRGHDSEIATFSRIPQFGFVNCGGYYRFNLGWFSFWRKKSRRLWTKEVREAHPIRKSRIAK